MRGVIVARRWVAAAALVAGVGVLAGFGWALLAAGALLWLTPATPDPARRAVLAWRSGIARAGRAWRSWRGRPRAVLATASMPAAMTMLPIGVGLLAGVGAGLVAAGLVFGGVSLLLGWNS